MRERLKPLVLAAIAVCLIAAACSSAGNAASAPGPGPGTSAETGSSLAASSAGSSSEGPAPIAPPSPGVAAGTAGSTTACGKLDLSNPTDGAKVATSAVLGSTEVSLTGTTVVNPGQTAALSSPTLTVKERGVKVATVPVAPPAALPPDQTSSVMPWRVGAKPPAGADTPNEVLCLAQFPSWTMPTVLMGLWTGGAHCCLYVRAIPVTGDGFGSPIEKGLGNSTASLITDGDTPVPILVTGDDSFTYVFAPFSRSGTPLKVLSFGQQGFVDVTAQHRSLIANDANRWFSRFEDSPPDGLGYLAAWVADECDLGQAKQVWRTLGDLHSQGKLSGTEGWPSGSDYVKTLREFLSQHSYCSAGG